MPRAFIPRSEYMNWLLAAPCILGILLLILNLAAALRSGTILSLRKWGQKFDGRKSPSWFYLEVEIQALVILALILCLYVLQGGTLADYVSHLSSHSILIFLALIFSLFFFMALQIPGLLRFPPPRRPTKSVPSSGLQMMDYIFLLGLILFAILYSLLELLIILGV